VLDEIDTARAERTTLMTLNRTSSNTYVSKIEGIISTVDKRWHLE
jgi:hypothetical protein